MSCSKVKTKEERARRTKLENTLKFLENNLTDNLKKQQYELLRYELDEIYDKIAEGVKDVDASNMRKEKNPKLFF